MAPEITQHGTNQQHHTKAPEIILYPFLTVRPSRRDGTELERDEFRDAVLLRMGLVPKNLPKTCDGCGATFTVEHALTCKKGGLVVMRHDDCRDEFGDIASKATTPSRVTTEPLIHYGGNSGNRPTELATPSESLNLPVAVARTGFSVACYCYSVAPTKNANSRLLILAVLTLLPEPPAVYWVIAVAGD
ncbi:hypothetical protein THAOC_21822 [Thalassiosira oceanica]|uniref:Uncharacterized protein n=1 Tax=Thalassiosira oceanica TaxID=159749 RepID=K0RW97_THAOC|nr:hypothetical protein THAOC_21822 [Thalassiosira oceanica]|eukprot:EJK58078.1 hypothetical protein THAOC_21822 [Thalassiosira oceanica]